jgi:hypothetical protein
MIITVLEDKYRHNNTRYMAILERPGILNDLNKIIEWDYCIWPIRILEDGTENGTVISLTDFLGTPPVLKPGNMFAFDIGQIIAVDSPDKLILCISETGPKALNRIDEEIIQREVNLSEKRNNLNVTFEVVSESSIPPNYKEKLIPYYLTRIFREKFLYGRYDKDVVLKVNIMTDYFIFSEGITVYINKSKMFFNEIDIDDDYQADIVMNDIIAWFYQKYDRIKKVETEEDTDIMDIEEKIE